MKKLLTLLFAFAVACSLSAPTFATKDEKKEAAGTTSEGKAHKKHAKKKGTTKGKKEGQQGTAPGEATKK